MRSNAFTGASALILLVALVQAKHGIHEHLEAIHRRHRLEREAARQANETIEKRGGTCAFPSDAGLVAVTPGSSNGGWAFAPDQFCTVGRYCAYACPPGQVSMQWDPSVTSYTYPGSRNGGLLCNSDGTVSKPFPDRPYCQSTQANIGVQNDCGGKNIAFCQTVLPGDEDMLIPTDITYWSKLAVPDTSYWAGTAAHYYINPPGVSSSQGCVWGSTSNPYGNWAPYVAGANTDASGNTFIKLGWNPIYLEPTTPFRDQMPNWGVRIECPDGGCSGLPCSIDPTKNKVNEMSGSASNGAGGGSFCVITVAKGLKANFVVFESGTGSGTGVWSGSGLGPSPSTGSGSKSNSTSSTKPTTSSSGGSKWSNVSQGGQFYQTNAAGNGTATKTSDASATDTPDGPPHYQLFDGSGDATQSVSQSPTKAIVSQHTGAASSIEASFALLAFGIGAILL